MAPNKAAAPLKAPDVYVRVRPLAAEGGHAEDGTVLAKVLQEWDESSVTVETQYMFSKGEAKYTYPKVVFGTEATQQEVCDTTVPDLVQSFTSDRTSVLFFAYGQTGTGKTRTMFGTEPSLASSEPHEDWGVFPRVCAATFERIAAMHASGVRCVASDSVCPCRSRHIQSLVPKWHQKDLRDNVSFRPSVLCFTATMSYFASGFRTSVPCASKGHTTTLGVSRCWYLSTLFSICTTLPTRKDDMTPKEATKTVT